MNSCLLKGCMHSLFFVVMVFQSGFVLCRCMFFVLNVMFAFVFEVLCCFRVFSVVVYVLVFVCVVCICSMLHVMGSLLWV